ncbi:phosphatase PAP2 family protein [Streptomyces sp. NPDC053367]|uniref:phosphatase PAP2 family protein n=1 Tax=Streptomyces sp. NPDC053367 TaxID=3365700 RepID=UPI0037D279CC
MLFALSTWQVAADGPLLRLDERLSRALVHPDRASDLLSDLGSVPVAVPVLAVAAVYAARRARGSGTARWWLPAVAAGALMALVAAVVVPVKELTGRPGTSVVPPGTGYFPSGHTATAAVAYGTAALLLWPWLTRAGLRRTVAAVAAALVLGTSYGLVRRGYHWPLDVVASWCLGALLLNLFVLVVSRSSRRRSAGTPSSSNGPS